MSRILFLEYVLCSLNSLKKSKSEILFKRKVVYSYFLYDESIINIMLNIKHYGYNFLGINNIIVAYKHA